MRGYILAIHSPISQSGGQVIVNGLDSMSISIHVSNSKETSKTVCQTKQLLEKSASPVVKLQEVMTLVHCTGIISNLATR